MTHRYVHVSIGPAYGFLDRDRIQLSMNDLAEDWLNYNTTCWVLWTKKSPITIAEMLQNHLNPSDQIIVFGLNSGDIPAGSMPQWIWEWLNRPRDPNTGAVLTPALPAPAATNMFANALLKPPPLPNILTSPQPPRKPG